MTQDGRLDRGDGVHLAWRHDPGRSPAVVFLPGFGSDMAGAKATAVAEHCAAIGQACLRLDYAGCGASEGDFERGTIGGWTSDALAVIDHVVMGDLLLVGSSMGGWIALLIALARPGRVTGLVGIAAAPDFTEDLIWEALPPAERAQLMRDGALPVPGQFVITRTLIEEGRDHLVLRGPIALDMPVRLLHGRRDTEVPWETALRLSDRLAGEDVRVILVKDGDHRLSRPADVSLLLATIGELLGESGGQPLPV